MSDDIIHENYSISQVFFKERLKNSVKAGQRFCFILGSGASKSSGIPLATELITEWHRELEKKNNKELLLEKMKQVGIEEDKYDKYFPSGDFKADSSLYFRYFDLMFPNQPIPAYKYLQKKTENAVPSSGYYALAMILTQGMSKQTGNMGTSNLVITTNFDSLTEDTCFYLTGKHPLVVGHESLAPFISAAEIADRPIVAKVHRDILFHPMNRADEMENIPEQWKGPLEDALKSYIPIVIGYAGADNTLMKLILENEGLHEIYWCSRKIISEEDNKELVEFLKKGSQRFNVIISDFDEVMYDIANCIVPEFENQKNKIPEQLRARSKELVEKYEQKNDKLESPKIAESADKQCGGLPVPDNSGGITDKKSEDISKMSDSELDNKDAIAFINERYLDSLRYCIELVRRHPDNASYYNSRGVTLHEMGRYDEALKYKSKAIELDSGNARYYNSRGITLHEMGRYDEALSDSNKAIELDSGNARYYNSRGITLHKMGRYDEALSDSNKAIELDSGNARYYDSRGVTGSRFRLGR